MPPRLTPAPLQSKCWTFTLNNYSAEDIVRLKTGHESVEYLIAGEEVCPTSGTPHLQGVVRFKKRRRMRGVTAIIGVAHVEVAREIDHAIEYCKKDDKFFEFGINPENNQGKRSDLDAVKDDIRNGFHDLRYFRENHSDVYSRNRQFIREYIQDFVPVYEQPVHPLRKFQAKLNDLLAHEPDDRKIIFVVDTIGNSGKSWFVDYYARLHEKGKAVLMQPAPLRDMAYAYPTTPPPRVLFLDVPRSRLEYLSYEAIEFIKNGKLFSSKYESEMKTFPPPHVVILMNQPPDMDKLSADRYHVMTLTPEDLELAPAVAT